MFINAASVPSLLMRDIEKKKLIDLVCSHPIYRDSGVARGFKQVPSLRYALDNAALELDNDSLFG